MGDSLTVVVSTDYIGEEEEDDEVVFSVEEEETAAKVGEPVGI